MSADREINARGEAVVNRKHYRAVTDPKYLRPLLPLIANGYTNRMIARQLGLTLDGAKSRVRGLFAFLGAVDRAQAVSIAYQRGLLTVDRRDGQS